MFSAESGPPLATDTLTLEYLLQLEPGDAMKLKDIMSCEYSDVKDELLSNKKTVSNGYFMMRL